MPESIEGYTEDLFGCRFADDSFDPEGEEDHLKESWDLFDHYSWAEVFPVWFRYLTQKCQTAVTIHSRPVQWLRPSIFEGYVRAANS